MFFRVCNENTCPSWSPWTPWSECSLTCGGGKRSKSRKCVLPEGQKNPTNQKLVCPGNDQETENCNTNKCPGNRWFLLHLPNDNGTYLSTLKVKAEMSSSGTF